MAHPFKHAESSARKFGGKAEDYLAIHNWFDESKSSFTDFRHRALRHHAEGIFLAERIFGVTIVNSDGERVPSTLCRRAARKGRLGTDTYRQRLAVTNQPPALDVWSAFRPRISATRGFQDRTAAAIIRKEPHSHRLRHRRPRLTECCSQHPVYTRDRRPSFNSEFRY